MPRLVRSLRLHRFRPISMSSTSLLSTFLALNRARYLEALNDGRGRNWTVVVGNEAGDLDSAACSIAYSYLASTLQNRPTVAILLTPRADLHLRAENLHAYGVARLHPSQADMLCLDDIPPESLPHVSASPFVLVDHNRMVTRLPHSPERPDGPRVVAIIDHHEDEGFHKEADPRLISVPVGSCASLVTQYFADSWRKAESSPPRELASLLLCPVFVDTGGLKPGGKAVPVDYDAADFLLPRSTFTPSSSSSTFHSKSISDSAEVTGLIQTLYERKHSVSHLASRDLLRRDYKEYSFESGMRPAHATNVGIATVPLSPKNWLHKGASPTFWESMDAWMDERGLDVLVVLCTYTSRKGRHKRQNFGIVKGGHANLKHALWGGLEASEELKLERRDMGKPLLSKDVERVPDGDVKTPKQGEVRVWKQGNPKATRKVVAPLVKKIIESI